MAINTVEPGAAGDSEQITGITNAAAVGFTATKISVGPIRAGKAFVDVGVVGIRYALDGSTPTSTTGLVAATAARVVVDHPSDVINFKMISVGANTTADITYFRERDTGITG